MTNADDDGRPDAEVVPLRPHPEDAPGTLPAVRADSPHEAGAAPRPAPVIYADITTAERRPVIPVPLRRENLRGTVEVFAGLQWHRARYHGLRFPLYVLALLAWAVVGIVRVAGRQVHWWWLLEQHDLRSDAVIAGDAREWRALHREAKETRKIRGLVLLAELVALAAAGAMLAVFGAWWAWSAAGGAAVLLLARAGRPDGHRIISPAVIPPQYAEPTQDSITEALGSLGIAGINQAIKDGRGIAFVSPVMRDGPGWGVQLDLPRGVTAGHIIARRPELASGLRRPLSATWPEGVPAEHEGACRCGSASTTSASRSRRSIRWPRPGRRTSLPGCRSAPTRGDGRSSRRYSR
jgi:DNA segregation ATPase FtsK/SpoIIIE, S-DNA-T family